MNSRLNMWLVKKYKHLLSHGRQSLGFSQSHKCFIGLRYVVYKKNAEMHTEFLFDACGER